MFCFNVGFTFPLCSCTYCRSPQPLYVVDSDEKIKPELHNPGSSFARMTARTVMGPCLLGLCYQGGIASSCQSHYRKQRLIDYPSLPPSGSSRAMSSTSREDDALPIECTGRLPPGHDGPSTVNILGGSITEVAGDYHNHGDVFHTQRLSIHNSQSGQSRRGCLEASRFLLDILGFVWPTLPHLTSMGAAYNSEERSPPPLYLPGTRGEVLKKIHAWAGAVGG